MLTEWYRWRHDRLIGWAAVFLAVSSLAGAVLVAVSLPWSDLIDDTWVFVAALLAVAASVVQAGAFVRFASAFFGDPLLRGQRLRLGALVLACAFLLSLAGVAITMATAQFASYTSKAFIQLVLHAASFVLSALAAAVAASAFAEHNAQGGVEGAVPRNRGLGWALALETLAIAAVAIGPRIVSGLVLGWADVSETVETAGFASDVLSIAAALLASIGFFVFVMTSRNRPQDSRLLRETWLVGASSVLLVAAVVALAGSGLEAWDFWRDGWLWKGSAPLWERLITSVCLTIAAALLADAFAVSRRQAFVARWSPSAPSDTR